MRLYDPKSRTAVVGDLVVDIVPFIDAEHRDYAVEAATYYLETRLRSSEVKRRRYCRPL